MAGAPGRPAGGASSLAASIALELPASWRDACAATTLALRRELGGEAIRPLWPHLSLCQSFVPAVSLGELATAVRRVLRTLPAGRVDVGGLASFADGDGSPAVLFLAAGGDWLRLCHARVVEATQPLRAATGFVVGNPAFDLDGYAPHITLAMDEIRGDPTRRREAARLVARLWSEHRPAESWFAPEEVVVKLWEIDPSLGKHTVEDETLLARRIRLQHP